MKVQEDNSRREKRRCRREVYESIDKKLNDFFLFAEESGSLSSHSRANSLTDVKSTSREITDRQNRDLSISNDSNDNSPSKFHRGRTIRRLVESCDFKNKKISAENPYQTFDGSISVMESRNQMSTMIPQSRN